MFRFVLGPVALLTGCIPYTVASTAKPVAPGQRTTTMSAYAMPSIANFDSGRTVAGLGVDYETRWGLDPRSDMGVRVVSFSGVVANYKRLLTDTASRTRVAIMSGAGIVNLGDHAHFETSLLISGDEGPAGSNRPTSNIVPYGGLRIMQVAPIAEGALHDQPTIGGFIGVRLGSVNFGVSPEVGVFYDHSALDVRRNEVVVVPAISFHGDRLIEVVSDLLRGRPPRAIDAGPRRPGVDAETPAVGPVRQPPQRCAGPLMRPCAGARRRQPQAVGSISPLLRTSGPPRAYTAKRRSDGPVRPRCEPPTPACSGRGGSASLSR